MDYCCGEGLKKNRSLKWETDLRWYNWMAFSGVQGLSKRPIVTLMKMMMTRLKEEDNLTDQCVITFYCTNCTEPQTDNGQILLKHSQWINSKSKKGMFCWISIRLQLIPMRSI